MTLASQESNPVAALSDMMDMIDASPKTVVAALNGPALGGGCVARRFGNSAKR